MAARKRSAARELRSISVALRQLAQAFDRLAPALTAAPAAATLDKGPRAGRKLTLTPARRVALKLQGQYMGYMRNLKPRQKSRIKEIRAAKGIRSAIVAARRLSA